MPLPFQIQNHQQIEVVPRNNHVSYIKDIGGRLSYPLCRKRNETMNTLSDEYFMKQALNEARLAAEEGEIPIGAVIVCNGLVIARAHNQTERLNDPTAHAEMLAITCAVSTLGAKYLTGCTLYVTIEPCVMCAGALSWAQLSKVVYGASEEKRGFTRYAPNALHPKTVVKTGVMAEECALEMKEFFRKKR